MQAKIHENTNNAGGLVRDTSLSPEDSAAMTALRSAVAGMKGKLEGIAARGPFNGIMERVAAPGGVTFEADTVGGHIWLVGQTDAGSEGGRDSFTCMAAGSTGERPKRSATSSAISR